MAWGAVIGAGLGLAGSYLQSEAGEDGADAQVAAARYATDVGDRQFQQTRQDLMPWLNAGGWALGQQQNFLRGDMSGFMDSAPYQAAIRQGTAQLDAGAAAGGNLWGGGTDADRILFGQDMAMRFAGDHYNRLAGLSGTGQTTANQIGAYGAANAANAGQNALMGGQAQASAYANSANAWSNGLNQLGGAFGQWLGNRPPGGGGGGGGGGGSGWNGQALPGQTVPNQDPWWI